jgi:hypothetical protein
MLRNWVAALRSNRLLDPLSFYKHASTQHPSSCDYHCACLFSPHLLGDADGSFIPLAKTVRLTTARTDNDL